MFIQLHTLTSYPGTLLNRDDAGFAKTMPFGGKTRTRVSSQCLKYHWRNFNGENAIREAADMSIRSRETFLRRVARPLIEDGHPKPLVYAVTYALKERLLSDKKASKSNVKSLVAPCDDDDPAGEMRTNQIVVLGEPEVRYLREVATKKIESVKDDLAVFWDEDAEPSTDQIADAADEMRDISKRDLKKTLKGMKLASGLDAALFGRMVTSDILARGDAAVHVAHAFTTHEQESESDYFTAVDELRRDQPDESGELGAALVQTQDLTSGLFYSYVVVDVPLLVSNVTGVTRDEWAEADRDLAAEVVRRFVHLMTTVSPGAKLGSTAPYAHAELLLAETGTSQPRTLANAFQTAASNQNVLADSYEKLGQYVADMDGMYGQTAERKLAARGPVNGLTDAVGVADTSTVPEVADWLAGTVKDAG